MHCRRCLYTDRHPLNLTFDEHGICSGCRIHEEKDSIDWGERWLQLEKLANRYRSLSGRIYDCIVPVSGARDSYFILHIVKHKLKLNPLLVTYNKQYNTPVGMRNLANLRIKFDCDLICKTVNPLTTKKITKETLRRFGSLYWHVLAGETVFPVQLAVNMKIPLIIWGAHQGVDQVGMFSHHDYVEMTRKYRKEHDLMGYEAQDLYGEMENLNEEHLFPYYYPDDYLIQRVGVRGIYLNNYLRWDTKAQHEKMIKMFDYETCKVERTFDYYNDSDSYVYMGLHDYIKSLKHGYSKVTDHASREIRLKRLKKRDAIEIVKKFTLDRPKHISMFCEWLGIQQSGLSFILDEIRNQKIWYRDDSWDWQRYTETDPIEIDEEYEATYSNKPLQFTVTKAFESSDNAKKYVLHGHGMRKSSN